MNVCCQDKLQMGDFGTISEGLALEFKSCPRNGLVVELAVARDILLSQNSSTVLA